MNKYASDNVFVAKCVAGQIRLYGKTACMEGHGCTARTAH